MALSEEEFMALSEQEQDALISGEEISTQKQQPYDVLKDPKSVQSYEDIETYGMERPTRGFTDVLTGRGGTPEWIQQKANEQYMNTTLQDAPLEEGSDVLLDFLPAAKVVGGAAGLAGLGYGGYKGKQLYDNLSSLKMLSKFRGQPKSEVVKGMEGLSTADKPMRAAMGGGTDTVGVIKRAAEVEGDRSRRLLKREIKPRTEFINRAIGADDIDELETQTKHAYGLMTKEVAKDNVNKFDGTSLLEDVDALSRMTARTDASERTVKYLKQKLTSNPNLSVDDALKFRAEINYELGKAKGDHIGIWKKLKANVDDFIDKNVDPAMKDMIDSNVGNYARMKNNVELNEVIKKATDKNGVSVDWAKANTKLKELGLDSPEAKQAMEIVEEMEKKFGNDPFLSTSVVTKGSKDPGDALSTWSYMVGQLKESFAMFGELHDNLKIQKSILRSLKRSKTSEEFAKKVIDNPQTPKEIRALMAKQLKNVRAARREAKIANRGKPTTAPKDEYYTWDSPKKKVDRTASPDTIDKDIVQKYVGDNPDFSAADNKRLSRQLDRVEGSYEGESFRGMSDTRGNLANLKVGDAYSTEGVTSIAKGEDVAKEFMEREARDKGGKKVLIKFDSFNNKPIDVKEQLGFEDMLTGKGKYNFIEDEVLVPKGRNYKVIGREEKDGVIHLIVKEL